MRIRNRAAKDINVFVNEIMALSEKHGLYINLSDGNTGMVVQNSKCLGAKQLAAELLREAEDGRKERPR